jgi:hypothetical protein
LGYATPKLNYAHQHKKEEHVMNKIRNAGWDLAIKELHLSIQSKYTVNWRTKREEQNIVFYLDCKDKMECFIYVFTVLGRLCNLGTKQNCAYISPLHNTEETHCSSGSNATLQVRFIYF